VHATPNLSMIAPHKLAPCSTWCVFIGYSLDHNGYRYLDLSTNHVVVSQHVVFDDVSFPFAASSPLTNNYEFFSEMDPMLPPIRTCLSAGTPTTMASGLTTLVVEAGCPTTRPTRGPLTYPRQSTAHVAEASG
jgi:hypothetical protein